MILVDANILLHAYNPRSRLHDTARAWLEKVLSEPGLVRFAWVTLWAFLRISTSPRVFEHPLSPEEAASAVGAGSPGSGFAYCSGLLVLDGRRTWAVWPTRDGVTSRVGQSHAGGAASSFGIPERRDHLGVAGNERFVTRGLGHCVMRGRAGRVPGSGGGPAGPPAQRGRRVRESFVVESMAEA